MSNCYFYRELFYEIYDYMIVMFAQGFLFTSLYPGFALTLYYM